MKKTEKKLFIIPFNSKLEAGCDYAVQTLNILGEKYQVIGVSLGDPLPLKKAINQRKFFETSRIWKLFQPIFLLPFQRFQFIKDLNFAINALILRVYCSFKFSEYQKNIWYFEPFNIPVFLKIFSSYLKIYDCVDYFKGFSKLAQESQKTVIQQSDKIFANSNVLYSYLRQFRDDVILVPQGFSATIFESSGIKKKKHSGFVVGFIGSICSRIHFPLLIETAAYLPEVEFRLVGPIEPNVFHNDDLLDQDIEKMNKLKNIKLYPAISKKDVPKVLATFDVGMIPYDIEQQFNKYSFPMKFLEYFYIGLPVISTRILELENYQHLLFLVTNSQQFITAIQEIKKTGWNSTKRNQQKQIAMSHSWQKKVGMILNELK